MDRIEVVMLSITEYRELLLAIEPEGHMDKQTILNFLSNSIKTLDTGLAMYPLVGWSTIKEATYGLKMLEKLLQSEATQSTGS